MHSAVWVTGGFTDGVTVRKRCEGKRLAAAVVAMAGLLFSTFLGAQSTEDSASENAAEPVRHVQRLGDVPGQTEWEPELAVPEAAANAPGAPRLPDDQQQQALNDLLARLTAKPENPAPLEQLNALLDDVLRQANVAIDAQAQDQASICCVSSRPWTRAHPGLKAAQVRLQSLVKIRGLLAAARAAMDDGRVDQPEHDNAWYFYRQIADQHPGNEEARLGLLSVQQDLLARALSLAGEQDFDAAEQLLDRAALVLEGQAQVAWTRSAIDKIKTDQVDDLELQAIRFMDAADFSAAERVLIDLIALGGQADRVKQLRQRMEEARMYGGFKTGQVIRDHFLNTDIWAPEVVIIPVGSYLMGSPDEEKGRVENEGPQHRVVFKRGFAMGRHEVSVAEFGAFIDATGFRTDAERSGSSTVYDPYSGRLTEKKGINWGMDYEGKPAQPGDPVIHVSWSDAQTYVQWLAKETGKPYRLPSEAEFEYALRAGSNTHYWWGNASPARVVENLTGEQDSTRSRRIWAVAFTAYGDKFWGPAPVASFEPNPFGLFDMGGNISEWVRDCWHDTYVRAPLDGSAWVNPGCDQRVIRGGYWASVPDQTRSAYRRFAVSDYHDARVGFRIVRDL